MRLLLSVFLVLGTCPDAAQSPTPRNQPPVVLDAGAGELLLFGGYGDDGVLGDTWTSPNDS